MLLEIYMLNNIFRQSQHLFRCRTVGRRLSTQQLPQASAGVAAGALLSDTGYQRECSSQSRTTPIRSIHTVSLYRAAASMSTADSTQGVTRSFVSLVMATEDFVKQQIAALNHDASHDWRYFQSFGIVSLAQLTRSPPSGLLQSY